MTEADWNSCTDPAAMLKLLQDKGTASQRKLRLFAVSCLRRCHLMFQHEDVFRGLGVAERFADGEATDEELRAAAELMMWAGDDASWHSLQEAAAAWAAWSSAEADGVVAARTVVLAVGRLYSEDPPRCEQERLAQCQLLQDIIGNPFRRPGALAPSLLAPDILALARAAYEQRTLPAGTLDPGRLAALADALEAAGCTDMELLRHLRSPGPHVRGCWAIDLLLRKE